MACSASSVNAPPKEAISYSASSIASARRRGTAGGLFECAQVGQSPMGRTHDFEGVERRHARARLPHIHARVGKDQAVSRRGTSDVQTAALGGYAVVLHA